MKLARAIQLLLLVSLVLAGCGPLDVFTLRKLHDGVSQTTPLNDGVTQTTPLLMGEVRLASGEPAVGVKVTAYVSTYQVSSTGESTTPAEGWTDASGRFRLKDVPLGVNTVEAVATEDSKAMRMNVAVGVGARLNLDPLVLQPTGTITGRVTADGGVNLLGTTVFIPGTQYMAMTAENGTYTIHHVPVGTYEVAAMRQTYATTVVTGVAVQPKTSVQAPEIALRLDAPVLESLSQANGGAGSEIVLRGRNFGASKNTVLTVTFGNVLATRAERLSDTEIRAWVPDGGQSGMVVVRSNGVASNALSFHVIAHLRVIPQYAGLYVGDRQAFDVEALDPLGMTVPTPFFAWELGADFLGSLSKAGELVTREAGWSEVRARSGKVTGLASVGVTPFQISPPTYANSLPGAAGHVVARPEGLYYTHRTGGRIYFEPPGGARKVVVGTGETGFSRDGTPALDAKLNLPEGLAVDDAGNVYFTERGNHLVRVVPRTDTLVAGRLLEAGKVYTVAGNGQIGFSGDGGQATAATLNAPTAVILGEGGGLLAGGTLLVSDSENGRIREVANDGTIATVIGGGKSLLSSEGVLAKTYGGGVGYQLARDSAGNLAFTRNSQVLFYCLVGGTYFGSMMRAGHVYSVAGTGESGFDGDGLATELRVWAPAGLAFDARGTLYFCDAGTSGVRALTAAGQLRWLAGALLPSTARLTPTIVEISPATAVKISPYSLSVRGDGALVVGDVTRLHFDVLELREPWPPQSQ